MKFRPGYLALAPLAPLGAAVAHAVLMPKKKSAYQPQPDADRAMAYAEKLAAMIRCDTTSYANVYEPERFERFHAQLAQLFPLVHEKLERTVIDGNLLFYWKGKAHDRPIVLMSHQDVVPAEARGRTRRFPATLPTARSGDAGRRTPRPRSWRFSRQSRSCLPPGMSPPTTSISPRPARRSGRATARRSSSPSSSAAVLRPFLVCDEGGGIITEPIGGIPGNFAMVGVFEKGKADVKFTARSNGGHASAPMANSPIARLSAFVTDVEKHDPFRRKFLPEVSAMFARLAPYAPFGLRLVMGNLWLFQPLMKIVLPRVSAQAGAMLHTTIAFTMQSGADAYNVLPQEATLGANMRFIPHQGEQESLAIIRRLAEKHGLEMEVIHAMTTPRPWTSTARPSVRWSRSSARRSRACP